MARDSINSTTTTGISTAKLDDDHWDRQRMEKEDVGCWKEFDAAHCQEASDALFIAISFFRKLIDVIEVKKVLKGLRSPLFGVHG
ncbi:unnamed protein product [Caenorhabditis nigoni]